jgi:hypothetical protein
MGGLVAVLAGRAPALAEDSWDAVYLAGSKIGYIHTYVEPVKGQKRDLLRVRVDQSLTIKRLNDRVTMKVQYGTIETPEGQVLRLDTRTLAAQNEIRVHGDVIDGKMTLKIDGAGQQQEKQLDWGPDVRGPYAAEQSLSRTPIKPGESRTLKSYVPVLNQICEITLAAKGPEEVLLGGGTKRSLLRVDQSTRRDGKPLPEYDATLWVDPGGQILKTMQDIMGGMVIYRTTKAGALAPSEGGNPVDQILLSVIAVTHKISRPESTRDITYRVTLKGGSPDKVIPNDRRQSVRPGPDSGSAVLTVKTAGPDAGEPGETSVDAVYLQPNAMITSNDARVRELTRKAVGDAGDPWEKAKRIERYVADSIRDKNFRVAFAPASEVAQNLEGDCTEHGVLTAAMCRAAGVPARVAVGLVYAEPLKGFGFHLWNEVFVNRRWVAIDSAFKQDEVDAVHIKLSDSSLDGVSPFDAFMPIVRVLGKMTLEPLEVR